MTHLSWASIFRLGLVQLCLGAIVVLTTSTLNRLMVVELALPAVLPGRCTSVAPGAAVPTLVDPVPSCNWCVVHWVMCPWSASLPPGRLPTTTCTAIPVC